MSDLPNDRTAGGIDRRDFLGGAAAAVVAGWSGAAARSETPSADGAPDGRSFPGLMTREKEPLNLEFPFPTLDAALTPTNRFFVRNHFRVPTLEAAAWRLKVEGEVEKEFELDYDQLKKLPSQTLTATIECAGNGRAFLVPKAKGVAWELGAVGNAEWTGVPLAAVLEKAGVKDGAMEVVLEGADSGEVGEEPKSPGVIHFERSLPLAKARKPEVLLAYRMNGKELTPEHGFPVRALVPGWFGMASVKWLTRVTVTAAPFQGFWQTLEYTYFRRERGRPTLVPVTEMQVKAEIARPALQEVVAAGTAYRVSGAAWAGESEIAKVEVSTDGGMSWQDAKLLEKAVPFSWRLWDYEWRTPKEPGRHRLMARATDKRGRTQAEKHDKDRRAYLINHTLPVEVQVR